MTAKKPALAETASHQPQTPDAQEDVLAGSCQRGNTTGIVVDGVSAGKFFVRLALNCERYPGDAGFRAKSLLLRLSTHRLRVYELGWIGASAQI